MTLMLNVLCMSTVHVTITFSCSELKKDVPTRGCFGYLCCCCWSAPRASVTVHLEGAQGLEKQGIIGSGDAHH